MVSDVFVVLVLFVYGQVLFAMALAIILEIRRRGATPLTNSLWWLAGFGLVHSTGEWVQILNILRRTGLEIPIGNLIPSISLFLLIISGFLLAQFGASLLASSSPGLRYVRWIPLSLLSVLVLVLLMVAEGQLSTGEWIRSGMTLTRYVLYFPGSVLAVLALLRQRTVFRDLGLPLIARDCTWGAVVFASKGFLAAITVPSAGFFPASVLNASNFVAAVGAPPELFRGLAAVGITYSVLRILRLYEIERQQEREKASRQLRQLSVQVLQAQEEERKRIARELHDDTAQALSSLLLQLKLLQRANTLEEVRVRNTSTIELVAGAAEDVRRMAYELRPAALEDLGLPAAIRWYAEHIAQPRGLSVDVQSFGLRNRLPAESELVLYRVVQEALSNVSKHSGAAHANVTLEHLNGNVRVCIQDNGKGFDVKATTDSFDRGLGLFGMQERVSLLGGTLQIDSGPNKGTGLTVEIPVNDKTTG